jgi:excisionase family DNA binding protein
MKDEFFSDEPVFDLSGAAKYLGISKVQMRTLARAGRVTYSRIDRLHWRFAKRDLDAFIQRNTFRAQSVFGEAK